MATSINFSNVTAWTIPNGTTTADVYRVTSSAATTSDQRIWSKASVWSDATYWQAPSYVPDKSYVENLLSIFALAQSDEYMLKRADYNTNDALYLDIYMNLRPVRTTITEDETNATGIVRSSASWWHDPGHCIAAILTTGDSNGNTVRTLSGENRYGSVYTSGGSGEYHSGKWKYHFYVLLTEGTVGGEDSIAKVRDTSSSPNVDLSVYYDIMTSTGYDSAGHGIALSPMWRCAAITVSSMLNDGSRTSRSVSFTPIYDSVTGCRGFRYSNDTIDEINAGTKPVYWDTRVDGVGSVIRPS